ncbi:4'-phosphopantetheinyl transferase family protein [Achromobacter sp. ESBL13]|uniref:4'-phosphopantetheinyl transferase family protein n=1 Tax=Achromobacter sp. ESBL13 TaxID=3077328 RepID=UPI002FC76FA3
MTGLHQALRLPDWVCMASMPVAQAAEHLLAAVGDEALAWRQATLAMSPGRRAEFVAGRVCAWRALQEAGAKRVGAKKAGATDQGPVLPVDQRLPVWPAGWLGSISHSGAWAVAAVASAARCQALGLDLQDLIAPQTVVDVQPLVATERELARMAAHLDRGHALTLLFSAKEALYKALYPRLRRFQDFDAAELTAMRASRAEVTLTLTRDWDDAEWRAGQALSVRYAWVADGVLTACCVAARGAGA